MTAMERIEVLERRVEHLEALVLRPVETRVYPPVYYSFPEEPFERIEEIKAGGTD